MKLTNNFLVLPNTHIDVSQLLQATGLHSNEATKKIASTGISSLRYAYPTLLTEFIFDGLSSINEKYQEVIAGTDAVIVVSQTYDQRIPSISTRIQGMFNLPSHTFCIDVMDGCSGYIKALNVASMLEHRGFKKILIVAGDLNSVMTTDADIGTKILFGDGISVSLFESDSSPIDIRLYNDGDLKNVISCSFTENIMNMNGFEVFRFTRNVVPPMINAYLEESGKTLQHYDLIALHQASKLVVSTIFATLKHTNTLGDDFASGDIGNIGAGTIGAWLAKINGIAHKGKLHMLAVGFGSGLSWGLASLVVDVQNNEVIYV